LARKLYAECFDEPFSIFKADMPFPLLRG